MLNRFLTALACTAAVASAQSLTTTFANNNGGAVGGAVYFDLDAAAPATIIDLDLNFGGTAGAAGSVDIYVVPAGTWVGNTANAAYWGTPVATGTVAATAGAGQPSLVTLNSPLVLAGPNAIAIAAVGLAHAYTNGATNPQVYTDGVLTLSAGGASNVPFVGTPFQPRVVNTTIRYTIGSGTLATSTSIGDGCYESFASVYENFATAAAFDLANTGFQFLPTNPGFAVVSGGTLNAVGSLATATPVALTDDSQAAVGTLGVTVGSNGWVAFGAGNSNAFTPTVATMLANPSTAFYTWHDMNPAAAGSGQVQYEEAGTQFQVTFDGVYNFGGTSVADANTIQFQGNTATGEMTIVFGAMSAGGNGWLVGYSPAGASVDPGNIDLSTAAQPIIVGGADQAAMSLASSSRPVTGGSWNLAVSNGALLDVIVIGLNDPMIADLGFLGAAGCGIRASVDLVIGGSTASIAVPNNATLVGFQLFANGASLAPGVNAFLGGVITSNGLAGVVGDI